ncbi:response regulator transcription factor [Streptomyces sp. NBC_01317]|uniref:response regulator n=1 Tax=Streptomyces sp. NBC_01317 TaxID=2903822 RepID=UPI002E1570DF|nr:response regulator transcription factor [Streptomyces sp. NBC_01317]
MTAVRPAGGPLSVLLCDDNDMLLDILCEVVDAQPDLRVVGTASDAEQAIQLALRHEPDVVVLDVRFPGGGPNVAREIARCSPDSRVVAFSAYGDKSSVEGMMRAGVAAYVLKGVTNREFLGALRRARGVSDNAR